MRLMVTMIGLLALAQGAVRIHAQQIQQSQAPMPAGQLVREVVYNELHDHQAHGYWRYWIERHSAKETELEDQVETGDGPITRLALANGHPLSAEAQVAEQRRLQHLLASPEEQARHRQDYAEDEQRIGRILAIMPDAFLYQYAAEENGCHKLSFRPDPAYAAHSIETRILHAMSGNIWIDARMKRLVRLDGNVEDNIDFGYGILGRLYKGGWFQFQRTQVSPTDWKTERLEVHLSGRALLLKSFARETSQVRGGFAPVPAGMSLSQGMALLQQTGGQTVAKIGTENRAGALTATALAVHP